MSQPKVKWLPTEEDKKDCHRCRNGWVLVKNELGYRAHWESDEKLLTCHATGPLVKAPPQPRAPRVWTKWTLQKLGYFVVGDVAIGAIAGLVYAIYYGAHYLLDRLPGGVETVLSHGRSIFMDVFIGVLCVSAATQAGEFLIKSFKKPVNDE